MFCVRTVGYKMPLYKVVQLLGPKVNRLLNIITAKGCDVKEFTSFSQTTKTTM